MLFQRISRTAPEKVFAIVRNLHSATLVNGDVVKWMDSGDTPPTGWTQTQGLINSVIRGVDVLGTAASGETDVAGVIAAGTPGILQGDFGTCQVYGVHYAVKTTVAALAVGVVVQGNAAAAAVAADAAAATDITKRRIGVCIVTGAANKAGIMLRAM